MHLLDKVLLADEKSCDGCQDPIKGFNYRCLSSCDVYYCAPCIANLNRRSKIVTTWLQIS